MAADLTNFLVAQLEAHGLVVQGADSPGPNLKVMCFNGHDNKSPSLSVRKLDGMFLCFGCGAKGHDWNALAAQIGGDAISEEDMPDPFGILNAQLLRGRLAEKTGNQELPWGVAPWDQGKYRGLSSGFLNRLEALKWYDDQMRCRRILFPIWQHQELLGWVARRLDKSNDMKYRNSPGMQATSILYPLDFVTQHLRNKVAVLVEGPMDALRLCHYRIPALAIMGTNNWRRQKLNLLLRLGVEHCIICTDADPAGIQCRYETLEPELNDECEVYHFFPPDGEDPGSMSRRYCLQLRELVERLAG